MLCGFAGLPDVPVSPVVAVVPPPSWIGPRGFFGATVPPVLVVSPSELDSVVVVESEAGSVDSVSSSPQPDSQSATEKRLNETTTRGRKDGVSMACLEAQRSMEDERLLANGRARTTRCLAVSLRNGVA